MNDKNIDEIDILSILRQIYKSKKTIFKIVVLFILIGTIYALKLPEKYTSTTIFILQKQESTSSFSGVASLVGINLGMSSSNGDIPSSMYPKISESPKYKRLLLLEIIDEKLNINLKEYLINQYDLKDLGLNKDSKLHVTNLEEECFRLIDQILSININVKDGFITISSTMPNAEYSAILTIKAREILQKIIIENKIESARQNLIFNESQLDDKKLLFDEIQAKLAYFSDSNINSVNSIIINEKNKLEAEFEIINAVVTELSKQVEQSKLQVKKDTPVFSTIMEATIPNNRTSPMRTQLVLIFSLAGLFFSFIFVLLKDPLVYLFSEIKNN